MNEELKVIITAQTTNLKQNVEKAKQQVASFKEQVQKASKDVDKNFKAMGESISKGIKTALATMTAVGTALVALGASTQEYRTEQAKLTTAFEAAGSSAEQARATYNDLFRVLGDSGQATEAANHLAKLTTEQQALSEWTTICEGVYATFGDSLPIEGLTEAANETAKTGTLTGVLADALNWAGVSEDAFAESLAACNTEAEREAVIREMLTELYSGAAAAYEENASAVLAQNEANAKLQSTLAALGEAVAPVVAAFTSFAGDALAVVVPYVQDLAEQYLPLLQSALDTVAATLSTVFSFVSEHSALLVAIGATIGVITTAITAYNVVAAVKAAMDALQVTTLGALASAYLAQAAAMLVAIAPYVAVVAAIAAVIAIIVVCVKHWDQIKEAVSNAWNKIKEFTSNAVSAVKDKFNELKEGISEKVNSIKESVTEKFNAVKQTMGTVMEAAKTTVTEKLNNMKAAYESNGGGIKGIVAATMEGIKGYYTAGYTFINTLTNGKLDQIVSSMKSKMDSAKNAVSNALNSIKEKFSSVLDSAKSIVQSGIDRIKSIFNFQWSLPHLKMPHFSISGKFSLNPPSVPHFSISWYKLGGVFDSTTLFGYGGHIGGLGEDGAEAIVPLEKNTGWLDKIATMLNEKQGGRNTKIVLQVDGKVFGEIAVDSINELTKMRGSLPLKFA